MCYCFFYQKRANKILHDINSPLYHTHPRTHTHSLCNRIKKCNIRTLFRRNLQLDLIFFLSRKQGTCRPPNIYLYPSSCHEFTPIIRFGYYRRFIASISRHRVRPLIQFNCSFSRKNLHSLSSETTTWANSCCR